VNFLSVDSPPETEKDILVLGVGNILLRDEGIGPYLVRELKTMSLPGNVELVDAGIATFSLVYLLEGRKKIIIVDAAKGGEKPGSIYRLFPEQIETEKNSPFSLHDIGLMDILMTKREKTHNLVIIGVEPEKIGWGTEISLCLKERIPRIIEVIMEEIGCLGEKE